MCEDATRLTLKFQEVSSYLVGILDNSLPDESPIDIPAWVTNLLATREASAQQIRVAYGLPYGKEATAVAKLLASHTPFAQALLKLCIRRLFYILRHVQDASRTLPGLLDEATTSRLQRTVYALGEYPRFNEPHFLQILPHLEENGAFPFGEGIVDPNLFSLVRSFLNYRKEKRSFGQEVPPEHSDAALNYLLKFITSCHEGSTIPDEGADVSWALLTALSISPERTLPLLRRYLSEFVESKSPSQEIRQLALLPEIFVSFRTHSFDVMNVSAIMDAIARKHDDPAFLNGELAEAIQRSAHKMFSEMDGGVCEHLYMAGNALIAISQLRKGLALHRLFDACATGIFALDKYCPLPGYVCVHDPTRLQIEKVVGVVEEHLKQSEEVPIGVVICGPSGAGKSYFVECVFKKLGFATDYKRCCAPTVGTSDIADKLENNATPLTFVDEVDKPVDDKVFSSLLNVFNTGIPLGKKSKVGKRVLFFACSQYDSGVLFERHLRDNRKRAPWIGGIDWYNRCKSNLIDLPGDSIRNDEFAWFVLTAISIVKTWGDRKKVDVSGVISTARSILPDPDNTRALQKACEQTLFDDGGVIRSTDGTSKRVVELRV